MSTRSADTVRLLAITCAIALSACASHKPKSDTQGSPANATATGPNAAAPSAAAAPVPDEVRNAYEAALTSLQAGDWDGAARALKPIVDAHPELPGPAVNLGIAYAHLNRNDEARRIVDSAAQASPGFAPAQHQLGRLLAAAGEFQAADAAYAHALSDDPNYALAYYDRAVLNELYLQKLPEALQYYEAYQQLQAKPDDQVARWITDLRRRTGAAAPPAKAPAAETTGATPPASAGTAGTAASPAEAAPAASKAAQPAAPAKKGGSS